MARPTVTPPDWATDGVYADPGKDWDGQVRLDDAVMALLAPAGLHPADPTAAPPMNSFLQALARVARYVMLESAGIGVARYGDGSDGDVTITGGTTTPTRDMYYNNLTITGTGVLHPAGFRVFVKGTLTGQASSIIEINGNDGVILVGPGNGAPTRGGQALSTFFLGGGDGAAGPTTNATPGVQAAALLLRLGGAGGAGGSDGAGDAGGAAQSGSEPAPTRGGFRHWPACMDLRIENPLDDNPLQIGGGVGGSSGGNEFAGGGGHGGHGGGGAGVIGIAARTIVLAAGAIIRANGGVGSAGNGGAGGAGGGGGGGGGLIVLVTDYLADSGATITVAGGAGGAGFGTGVAGSAGADGRIINLAPA